MTSPPNQVFDLNDYCPAIIGHLGQLVLEDPAYWTADRREQWKAIMEDLVDFYFPVKVRAIRIPSERESINENAKPEFEQDPLERPVSESVSDVRATFLVDMLRGAGGGRWTVQSISIAIMKAAADSSLDVPFNTSSRAGLGGTIHSIMRSRPDLFTKGEDQKWELVA